MIKTGTARNQLIDMIEYLPEAVVNQLLTIARQHQGDRRADSGDPVYYTKEEFFQEYDRRLEEVHAGLGITKTLDEIKAIEERLVREDG